MDDVFLKLVNLSISASWLILAVLVLRVVLKKAPKWVMPLLWGVVALRLVCLFSIESALSLIPSAETIPTEIVTETPEITKPRQMMSRASFPRAIVSSLEVKMPMS